MRDSSGSRPPSPLVMWLRWKQVASFCSGVAFGRRSPANCSIVKLVERQVAVERGDHPIAPRPVGSRSVALEAVGIGVAGGIEPPHRHALAEMFAREEAIDQPLVGLVVFEGGRRVRCRRETGEIEAHAAGELIARGLRGKCEAFFGEARLHEGVDRLLRARRRCGPGGLLEGPVFTPRRAGLDPAAQGFDLLCAQLRLVRFRRRHQLLGIVRDDAGDQVAGFRFAGDDGDDPLVFLGRAFVGIQAKARFSVLFVGTVATETIVRENGQHLAAEARRLGGAGSGERGDDKDEGEELHGRRARYREIAKWKWVEHVRASPPRTRSVMLLAPPFRKC